MAPLSIIGALSALPLALAHMQMSDPSPINDPHQSPQRPGETLDYNYLSPLNADGSNFACKGYHLNTPLNTVATYEAGSTQTLTLRGSATHGGGSCQISLSCDGGSNFNVIKSIMGGCPLSDSYNFTVPSDIPAAEKCLLSWTWFNRIGNREMYMNCAVVDITNKNMGKRDTQASAAKALATYPQLFVANLADINSCRIPETTDVIFDTPGKQVAFGNGDSASMQPSFGKGQCTAKPSKSASSKPPSNSGGGSGGSSSQWTSPKPSTSSSAGCTPEMRSSGNWYAECFGGNSRTVQEPQPAQQQKQQQVQQPKQDTPKPSAQQPNQKKPNTKVQQELDAYLATLYGRGLTRRNTVPAADSTKDYEQKKKYSAKAKKHTHAENCEHKTTGYPSGSHYHNTEDLDPYPEDGTDYSNKYVYSTQDSQYDKDPDSAYKRTPRQNRWTSYKKRQDVQRNSIESYRGDESADYQQQGAAQASAQASTNVSMQASAQTSAQSPGDSPAQKSWTDMTDQEKFAAFLRRMVELSANVASLIKYAAASTVNIPYYPPASTYNRTEASTADSAQNASAVRRHARRDVLSSTGSPGDATNVDDGFKEWFHNLVKGSMTKRQLVDPVTSEASAETGDGINFFDALLASFWKAFGDPFDVYGDYSESDPVPTSDSDPDSDSENIPLVLGEPDFYSSQPDIPDFDIPDLDGHYTFPPQISAPEPHLPELLPGYVEGPDGPIWVGEGPDPLGDNSSSEPSIIISIDPVDPSSTFFPGEDVPTSSPCTEPVPQIGFNSCLGGCNHTAEEIATHDAYLQHFAAEQAAYRECLQNATPGAISSHGILPFADGSGDSSEDAPAKAEDASGRRPRPGMSHPLIPYPLPDNFTGPYPSNATSEGDAPYSLANATALAGNDSAPVELQPYQNKTLGELVSEIVSNPEALGPAAVDDAVVEDTSVGNAVLAADAAPALTPVPSNSSDDLPSTDQPSPSEATNPLQEAADQAEEGITVPQDPVEIDPNALESIADALPWLMGPGPVITSPDNEQSGGSDGPQ